MLRLVSDENFNGRIVRGLRHRRPELDLVRVQDVGLMQATDADILEWAAQEGRVLLTHDIATIPSAVEERLKHGKPTPGVLLVQGWMPIGRAITEILFYVDAAEPDDLKNQITHFRT